MLGPGLPRTSTLVLGLLKIHGLLVYELLGSMLNYSGLHHHGVLNMLLRSSRMMHWGGLSTECGLLLKQFLRHLTAMS